MERVQRLTRSFVAQITGLVAVSVLLSVALVLAFVFTTTGPLRRNDSATVAVARVSEITRLANAAKMPAETEALLAMARSSGLKVERAALAGLVPEEPSESGRSLGSRLALRQLAAQPGVELIEGMRDPAGPPEQIITRLGGGQALVFGFTIQRHLWPILVTPPVLVTMIVLIFMLLLSAYAVRWVAAPLAEMAGAAASFGRSAEIHQPLERRGPDEIIQVIDALNDMRTRIRALIDDRTRMLAAISHDLRTPLTRLRLRAERVDEEKLRGAMLGDLAKVSRMLDETLDYLRDDAHSEPASRIDLASFLQTICTDFADMGHAVAYAGPARLPYACRPRALGRAVTNLVENAVKHGGAVTASLGAEADGGVEIEIADDGPGIPAPLRDKVFEPFFKADSARGHDNSGFGLGLSIALDIVKRHGGSIAMRPREPNGLRVLMALPPEQG